MEMPDPTPLTDLAISYWRSAALLAANRLGVFQVIGEKSCSVEAVTRGCNAEPEAMGRLLRALCSLGMLVKQGDSFANSPLAREYLVPGRRSYLGEGLKYLENVFSAWGGLADAVRTGQPAMDPARQLGGDQEQTRSFVRAMHNRALAIAPQVAEKIDLSGKQRLLDIGGGPGTYSLLLCKRFPGLTAEVLDLPAVTRVASEIVREWQMEGRVALRPGNYMTDRFGNGYDAALLSGILHRETPETCRDLIRRAAGALSPGGVCIAVDVFLNERKDGPEFAALFALNMMLTSEHGSAHSWAEAADWLKEAGLENITVRHLAPPSPHTIVCGQSRTD
jgi:hypothetical protein